MYGDSQGARDVAEFERSLLGAAYDRGGVAAALAGVDGTAYFGAVTPEEVAGVAAG